MVEVSSVDGAVGPVGVVTLITGAAHVIWGSVPVRVGLTVASLMKATNAELGVAKCVVSILLFLTAIIRQFCNNPDMLVMPARSLESAITEIMLGIATTAITSRIVTAINSSSIENPARFRRRTILGRVSIGARI